jgi:hypothetical protein
MQRFLAVYEEALARGRLPPAKKLGQIPTKFEETFFKRGAESCNLRS